VGDVALLLAVLSQPDVRDPQHVGAFDVARAQPRSLLGIRIAYSATLGYAELDAEVAAAFSRAIASLRAAGAQLTEVDPGIVSPAPTLRTLFSARAAWTVRDLDAAQRAQLDPAVLAAAEEGARLSATDLLSAEAARVALQQHLAHFHRQFDVLLTPTSAGPAPSTDAAVSGAPVRASLAGPFSLTRQPALSIPCGLTRAGLPIGLQIVGRHYEEHVVLTVARAFEHAHPFDIHTLA
jgi:aspartyl-tRNA(Asn)/glutamyl-tRNA(Gln) amidotransferase subunit A